MSAMRRVLGLAAALVLVLTGALLAAPRGGTERPDPRQFSPLPSYLQRVEPAVVGIRVEAPRDRPSSRTLGTERWGSGIIVDSAAGYVLTVSYVLLDASRIEVSLRDGRRVPARLVGLDLEVGVGVAQLLGTGPWPAAQLGDSRRITTGQVVGTVGVDDDGRLVGVAGRVDAVRPFSASWEYMLERAFVVSPHNTAFGGAALVDDEGRVVGVTSLRLGEAPHVNLAIPLETFLPGKDEILAKGRVASRRPRPWLGLYTLTHDDLGLIITGVSPVGPAHAAGLRRGDIIVRLNGETVASQEAFYTRLWQGTVDQEVRLVVKRDGGFESITVKPADRYRFYHTTDR
jgi:S1-C subfamily serine protease